MTYINHLQDKDLKAAVSVTAAFFSALLRAEVK
jgi:hypothetical protein